MKTTLDYLRLVMDREPQKITNDNQLAIRLGVTRQAISQYRKGQTMSVAVALKVARALDIEPTGPVFSTMYHQAQTQEEKDLWMRLYQDYDS